MRNFIFPMETNDDALTEQLYRLFSHYPFPAGMQGCPCCVSDEHFQLLRSKPLRQLGDNELSRYAFKALTTWGTTEDFKYYLPCLFELYLSCGNSIDASILLDKLSYGDWRSWPEEEQEMIKLFLMNWWSKLANSYSFDIDTLIKIGGLCNNTNLLLEQWDLDIDGRGFRNFIDFTYDNYCHPGYAWLRYWVCSKREIMEKAFFHFEKSDPVFAQKISNALYTIEHS